MKAAYQNDDLHYSYVGNPLIEALPLSFSDADYAEFLVKRPNVDMERAMKSKMHQRLHDVRQIGSLFVPSVLAVEMAVSIDVEIAQGLNSRFPFSAETQRYLDQVRAQFEKDIDTEESIDKVLSQAVYSGELSGSVISVIGPSGSGKTSSILSILKRYPQMIAHSEYQGRRFRQKQLVWLSIDAPPNGAISALCDEILTKIDTALGLEPSTGYASQYSKKTIGKALCAIVQIAATHYLGIMHVDDLHLCAPGNGDGIKLVAFLIALANRIRCPLILSGTSKMQRILGKSFEASRRAGKCYEFGFPESADDFNYEIQLESLFEYQLTPEHISPEEFKKVKERVFYLTRGIPAVVSALFRYASEDALRQEHRSLSVDNFNVGFQKLKLIHPALDALRSGDMDALRKFEDLTSLAGGFSSFFSKETVTYQ